MRQDMDPRQGVNFFEATGRREVDVKVSWGSISISVLPFLKAVVFSDLSGKIGASEDPEEKANLVLDVLRLVLSASDIDRLDASDIYSVLSGLMEANPPVPRMAWQDVPAGEEQDELKMVSNVDYEGRDVAYLVALLSSVFGWTSNYILNELTYYEVMCYVQEALLVEHSRQAYEYQLADVGFKKSGNEYTKVPFPDLPWIKKTIKRNEALQPPPVPKKFEPNGVIVDFSQYAKSGQVLRYEIKSEEDSHKKDDGPAEAGVDSHTS